MMDEPDAAGPVDVDVWGVSWRLRRTAILGGASHFYAMFLSKGFAAPFSGALLGFAQTRVTDDQTGFGYGKRGGFWDQLFWIDTLAALALLVATLVVAHRVWSALRPPLRVGRVLGWVCAFESVLYLVGLVTTALVIGLANSDYVEAYSSLTGYDGTSFYFGYEVTMATGSDLNVSYLVAFAAVVGVQILVVWWSVGVVRRLGGPRLPRTVRTPQP